MSILTRTRTRMPVPPIDTNVPADLQTATFPLGWFWGPDARFGLKKGVYRTRVGYAGGTKVDPTYHRLGDHTETLEIDYDPNQISYTDLLDFFWENHNATRQPWSRQYMSLLFYRNDEEKNLIQISKQVQEEKRQSKMYTEILLFETFYLAEAYHQKYYLQLVKDLVLELKRIYPDVQDFVDSTAAARINGYLKGSGSLAMLREEIDVLGLSERGEKKLLRVVSGYEKDALDRDWV